MNRTESYCVLRVTEYEDASYPSWYLAAVDGDTAIITSDIDKARRFDNMDDARLSLGGHGLVMCVYVDRWDIGRPDPVDELLSILSTGELTTLANAPINGASSGVAIEMQMRAAAELVRRQRQSTGNG